MMSRIVILCESCPFGGEPFLQNELRFVPNDIQALIIPARKTKSGKINFQLPPNVELSQAAIQIPIMDRFCGSVTGIIKFIQQREYKAAFLRSNAMRNCVKAIKFAIISEGRIRAIKKWLQRYYPEDCFLFYSYWMYETAYTAARLGEIFPHSKAVTRCHGFDLYEHRHPNGYLPFREYILSSMTQIFPIAQNGVDYLSHLYNGEWDYKISLQRLGTMEHGTCEACKSKHFTVVSCSNLLEVKRVDRIIEALKLLSHEVDWVHIGDGPLMGQLKAQARGLPNNIHWSFIGRISNADVMEFYRNHHVDVFVNTSVSEGIPVSIMEALSWGVPAIATNVGGESEIIQNGVNGFLISGDELVVATELAHAIERIYSQTEIERDNMCARSKDYWCRNFNAENNYEKFYIRIRNILST